MNKENLYHHCMMCKMVDIGEIRIHETAYMKAGGNPELLTSGICENNICKREYSITASGGDSVLMQIIQKELQK